MMSDVRVISAAVVLSIAALTGCVFDYDALRPHPSRPDDGGVPPVGARAWARSRLPGTPGPGFVGVERSYMIGSETVVDRVTELEWQRSAGASLSQPDAIAHCERLTLGGFDDWVLPSTIELLTLVNYQARSPAIDTSAFPDTASESYWTASPDATPSAGFPGGWYVDFDEGASGTLSPSALLRTRCVRDAEIAE